MSIIKHVTLQKIVAHDFRYDPRITSQSRGEYIRLVRMKYSHASCQLCTQLDHKTGNVCINVTLRCVHLTAVAVEKQEELQYYILLVYVCSLTYPTC